jgi:polyhydroxyalkanoate synthase subunit PhaC
MVFMVEAHSAKDRPVAKAAQRLAHLAATMEKRPPRLGPQPLGLHLTTALSMWLSLPLAWRSLKSGFPGLRPETQKAFVNLAARLGPGPNPDFERALADEIVKRGRRFIGGIKTYRHHPVRRNLAAMPIVWQAGTTVLRDYNPSAPHLPVVLVVPSLINRFDILDLDRDHSFLHALAERGLRPLVVDWDSPGDQEKDFALADYVEKRLDPILDFVTAENQTCNLIGYCMGGNLALAMAILKPEKIRSLTLLATPWNFHQPDALLGPQFKHFAAQMEPYLQTLGYLPAEIVQSLFAGFQPTHVVTKFIEFSAFDPASAEARHFVLLEDWLNDGVPLTANVARECLKDWYGDNRPGKIEWRIGGKTVDPRVLTMPSYVVVPGKDRIVPPESALPLAKLLPQSTLHEPMMGHIGMIASEKAPSQVWKPFMSWLEKHA